MKGRYVVALLLLVAAVVPSLAFTAGNGARSSIEMIGKATGLTLVDADHSGKPSLGDYEIGKVTLVDPGSGAIIGQSVVNCTILSTARTEFLCLGYNRLRGGELVLAGHFSALSKTYRLAIVGGTGDYAGAGGWENGTWLDAKFTKVRIKDTFTTPALG
jgi:hypothetical protein